MGNHQSAPVTGLPDRDNDHNAVRKARGDASRRELGWYHGPDAARPHKGRAVCVFSGLGVTFRLLVAREVTMVRHEHPNLVPVPDFDIKR
ncbi:MAG: hypothetical protein KF883_13680 [Thermomicrobiales bacterium]|nr:hypothetical protein [Thermomicrobiales bacterium]